MLRITVKFDQRAWIRVLKLAVGAELRLAAQEDARQRIIVALRHRIEFVIMASRTSQRESEHRLRHRVDLLIDEIHRKLPLVALIVPLRSDGQKAGGDDLLGLITLALKLHQITRDLLLEEEVIRLVLLERFDHIIAVTPRMRIEHVHFLAAALRVARHIQPVPRPALAVAFRIEIHVDHALHRVR